jgi:hypothetical protein
MQNIWHHDTQHNDAQINDTQHNDTRHNDIQHNDTRHNDIQHSDTQHNDAQQNGKVLIWVVSFMPSFMYAERCKLALSAECHNAKCR